MVGGGCIKYFAAVAELMILGGAEEVGANSCYLNFDGTGILIDAGLHPRERNSRAFPAVEALGQRVVDMVLLSHAHTDHLGGLPFVLRRYPHARTLMTYATRDLTHIMLHNNGKLLRGEIKHYFQKEALEFYNQEQIDMLRKTFEGVDYDSPILYQGPYGDGDVKIAFHWAGHILGSEGLSFEHKGLRVLHTGDVQFEHQKVIQKARLPRVHADVVITEATNCATDDLPSYAQETKRLGAFINRITGSGGSVLIPCFALGKLQEILARLHGLMRKGTIPHLPIYTGGMGTRVSKVYDEYCYTEPMRVPGFEISDIPQETLEWEGLHNSPFFKEPSIVVAASGMLSKRTMSYVLAKQWVKEPTFGIGFIGYQDPETPGYALLHSEKRKAFDFGGKSLTRVCEIERFRFSAHASIEGLVDFITDVKPKVVAIVHGEPDACDSLALALRQRLANVRVIIPSVGTSYRIDKNKPDLLNGQPAEAGQQTIHLG